MPQPNLADSFHGPARYNTVPGFAKNSIVPGSSTTGLTPRLNLVPQAPAGRGGLNNSNLSNISSGPKPSPSAPTTGYQDSALDPASTTPNASKPSAPTTLDGPATQTSQTIETPSQPANYIVPTSPSTDSLFNPTSTNSNPATTPTPPVTPLHSNPSTGTDSPPTRSTTPTNDDESPAHRWLPALLILLLLLGIGWFFKTRIDTRLARQAAEQAALSDRLNSLNDDASLNNLNVANLTSKLATIENLNVTDTATINHLRVTGDSNLSGGVNITGPLTLNGDLVSGNITSTTSTTGSSTTTGQGTFGSLLVQGDATVQGNTSLNSLSAGATTLNSLIVSGNTSLGGNLSVQGNTTLNTLTASAFFGNGAGLTNLNATNITSGTLQDARLSSNVALLDRANQTFIGNNTFGSNLSVQGTTSLQALNVASGLTVSSASPIVATFNGRVVGTDAINTNEFVTLGQLTTVSAGNFFIQNGNSFGTTATLGTNDNQPLAFETNGVERVRVTESGNVGVGTSTPGRLLHISGVGDTVLRVQSTASGAGSNAALELLGGNPNAHWLLGTNRPDLTGSGDDLFIYKGQGTPGVKLTIKDNGNVGIGTTAPGSKLEVQSVAVDPATGYVHQLFNNTTTVTAPGAGVTFGLRVNNNGAASTLSQGTYYGLRGNAVGYQLAGGTTAGLVGGYLQATSDATSTGAYSSITGSLSQGSHQGSGSIVNLYGGFNEAHTLAASSGTITSAQAIYGRLSHNGSGTIISGSGLRVGSPAGTGTITTQYGVYVEAQARAGVGTAYGVYQAGASDLNYFAGNVGIGTTTPAYKLDVVGDINSSTQLRVGGNIVCTSTGCTGSGGAASFVQGGNSFGTTATLGTNDAFDLALETGGTTKLTVKNSTGNVGIGTVGPNFKLEVAVTGNNGIRISNSGNTSSDYAVIDFVQGGSQKGVIYTNNENLIINRTGTGHLLLNISGGNVGIGTTSPGNRLHVQADVNRTGAEDSGGQLRLSGSTTPTKRLLLGYDTTSNYGFVQSVESGAGYRSLALNPNGGDVGIGTTTPAYKLDVVGDINSSTQLRVGGNVVCTSTGCTGSGGAASFVQGGNSFGTTATLGTNDAFDLALETGGTTKLTVQNSTGNVGIGTASPTEKLNVSGGASGGPVTLKVEHNPATAGQARLSLASTGAGGRTYTITSGDNTYASGFGLHFESSGGLQVTFKDGGNVGIGTTGPLYKLDVAGDINATGVHRTGGVAGITANCLSTQTLNGITTAGGIVTGGTCATNSTDIAENYDSTESLQPGDIVATDPASTSSSNPKVKKTTTSYQPSTIGIVSTKPYRVLGDDRPGYPIALIGRVPTKVSTQNGPIAIGDAITSSDVPGVGMKATGQGRVVGIALEAFNATGTGSIEVFVNPSWSGSGSLAETQIIQSQADSSTISQNDSGAFTALNVSGATTLTNLTVTGAATFQSNLSVAGTLTTQDIVVRGHIRVGQDTGGTVTIPAGQTEVNHAFKVPYALKPQVVVTPEQDPGALRYWVVPTPSGFTLHLSEPAPAGFDFNYFVIEAE